MNAMHYNDMKKMNHNIVFTAENPGAFQAILPVVHHCIHEGIQPFVLLSGSASDMAKKEGIACIDMEEHTQEKVAQFFIDHSIDLVVAGTSAGMSIEKHTILEAQKKNIRTIAVVDFWSNYTLRFSTPYTQDLKYLSDTICVIDQDMKNGLVREGIPQDRIVITGNPFFDTWSTLKNYNPEYIVFVSQPFSEVYDSTDPGITSPVFNEIEIFSHLVSVLELLDIQIPLRIALHPRCKKRDKYNRIIQDSFLDIHVADASIDELLSHAHMVIGINSIVLFQASLMGLSVVSIQPGILKETDCLKSNVLGISHPVYETEQLTETIRRCLSKTNIPNVQESMRNAYVGQHATEKVFDVIKKHSLSSYERT